MYPSFMNRLASLCVSTAFIAAFAGNSHAAPITWGPATTVAADTDVSTTGTLQYAVHWGGTDATLNGVAFTAPGASTVTTSVTPGTNANIGAYVGLSAAYRDILKGNWYTATNQTATLNSLTVGRTYQVQIWSADIRYTTGQFTDIGSGPSLLISNSSSNNVNVPDYGQYAIGVFTADAITQVISFPNTGNGVVNAIMVRDITGSGSSTADTTTSSVGASAAQVSADGSASATITVTLRDAALTPVSGKEVSLSSSRGAADAISAPSGPSDGSGVVTFTVTSTTPGSSIFTATDVTDGNLTITQTATVNFTSLVIGGQQFNAGNVLPSPITALSGDLLETSVATATTENTTANLRNGSTGTAGETTATNPAAVFTNPSTTYNLNLAASPQGYNIQEIRLFSGWTDSRAGQSYSISYSLASDPATFIPFGTISALRTNGSLLTRTYDVTNANILTGVAAIRFTMINNGNAGTGTVFREFDVIGTAIGGSSADYTAWRNFYGLSGDPDNDDDGDGLSNREEYAFGLIPNSGSSVNPIFSQLNKATGQFSYTRRLQSNTNLTYTVRSSTTLAANDWTNLVKDTDYTESVSTTGDIETVTITLTPSLMSAPKLFVQVLASN